MARYSSAQLQKKSQELFPFGWFLSPTTTRNHLICDEFWRNFCNVFRDRHRFANGPFGLQFGPSFYDEPLITVMDWKLKSSQNKLPLFACDGRKKFSRRIGDKKNKELLTKKNNDKKLEKKKREWSIRTMASKTRPPHDNTVLHLHLWKSLVLSFIY